MSESAGLRISRRGGWWLVAVSALGIAGGLYRVMHEPAGPETPPIVALNTAPERTSAGGPAISPIPKANGVDAGPARDSDTNRPLAGIPVAPPAPPGRTNALGTAPVIASPPVVAGAPSQAPSQSEKALTAGREGKTTASTGGSGSSVSISNREVEQATEDWRKAWSARQLDSYLSFYGSAFPNRTSFIRRKTSIIQAASTIEVTLDNLTVSVNGNEARVQFRQSYKSDKFQSVDQKELVWVRENGRLVITAENSRD